MLAPSIPRAAVDANRIGPRLRRRRRQQQYGSAPKPRHPGRNVQRAGHREQRFAHIDHRFHPHPEIATSLGETLGQTGRPWFCERWPRPSAPPLPHDDRGKRVP
jgi:N-formylglutamate amidohydrolase